MSGGVSSPTNMKLKAERVLGNARPAPRKIINLAELYLLVDFFAAAHRFFCASAILARASALSLRIGLAALVLLGAVFLPGLSSALERSFFTS